MTQKALKESLSEPKSEIELEFYKSMALHSLDIARKWGSINLYDTNEVVFWTESFGLEEKMLIVSDSNKGWFFTAVLKGSYLPSAYKLFSEGNIIIPLTVSSKIPVRLLVGGKSRVPISGEMIVWDRELPPDDAARVLKKIDESARKMDLVDVQTGKRLNLRAPSYFMPGKFRVFEEFSKEGTAYPIFPRQDPERILSNFDHPEHLVFRLNPYKPHANEIIGLIRASDSGYFSKWDEVLYGVIRGRGLTLGRLSYLSPAEQGVLKDEIEAEVGRRMAE